MEVSLDKVCDLLRKWGDLPLGRLREMVAERMGDSRSTYKGHSRGELLALLMGDVENWEGRAPVCTR
jgi:hypothetical protein